MESDGDLVPKDGGAKRWRLSRRPLLLPWVGDRPAAGGADTGAAGCVWRMLGRGVIMDLGFGSAGVVKVYRGCLEQWTSSSTAERFRFPDSRFGSTFSLSELSGDACLRLRDGAECVIATMR